MTQAVTSAAPVSVDPRTRTQIVVAVLLGLFLAALDQTVVGTALPRIVTDLRGNDIYTWAFTSYLLTATISGPIYGKLSDLFGRRPILLFAVSVFLVGSLLSGLSQEMWQFVAFRAVQGLGAGALFPVALAVIGDMFDPSERGKYQGLVGAIFGLSSVIGPAIGGVITDTVGWHWVFFVNLPLGAVVFTVVWRVMPSFRPAGARPRIDYLGASVLAASLVPILVGLTNKQTGNWGDPAVGGLIVLGLAVAAIFVWVESRASEPIVPLGLFRTRSFTISVIAMFFASMAFFAPVVFLPRWFQVVGGASATQSGYQILALLGGLIISAMASGQSPARASARVWSRSCRARCPQLCPHRWQPASAVRRRVRSVSSRALVTSVRRSWPRRRPARAISSRRSSPTSSPPSTARSRSRRRARSRLASWRPRSCLSSCPY